MARELEIKHWCDICLTKNGDKVEGRELPPVPPLGGGKPKVLTVCPPHEAEAVIPFFDALAEYGIENPDKPIRTMTPQPENKVDCLICERIFGIHKSLKNEATLGSHTGNQHRIPKSSHAAFAAGELELEAVPTDQNKYAVKVVEKK